MFNNLFQRTLMFIRDWLNKMITPSTIKKALNVDLQISSTMANKLQIWSDMYINQAAWLDTDPVKPIVSLNLPATIAGEIARAVTIEAKVELSGGPRATYLQTQLKPVLRNIRQALEFGQAKGGLVFKPYPRGDRIAVDFVQADQFYPIAYDTNGDMTAAVFSDSRKIGNYYFTRLEYHSLEMDGYHIQNAVFRSSSESDLGSAVSFETVPEWADLKPSALIQNVTAPLFGYFRPAIANNIEPGSPLGVSCYSRAVDLIEQADRQWSNLIWEFYSGERAIYVDRTAFDADSLGYPKLPNRRLYRPINGAGNVGENKLFDEWSPEFRDASIRAGLNDILKRIEFNCGLAYGTISDPQVVEKTATEIQAAKQRSAATIVDNQKALQDALDSLLYGMDVYATLYRLAPLSAYNVTYDWDDSIVSDHDTQYQQDFKVASANMMPYYIFLMRNYHLSEKDAKRWIAEKEQESQNAMNIFGLGGNTSNSTPNNPNDQQDNQPATQGA